MTDAATHLFALRSPEAVTVAEIAEEAGMTSAAVYYHFSSKDDILLEALRGFGAQLVDEARRLQAGLPTTGELADLLPALLAWTAEHRDAATVWFVWSSGLSLPVEVLRREVRTELVSVLLRAVRTARPGLPAAQAAVAAAALLALLDTSATTQLSEDETMSVLGEQGLQAATAALVGRILGAGTVSSGPVDPA